MGYLDAGEIFENMLQLKRFGLYFEIIHIEIIASEMVTY